MAGSKSGIIFGSVIALGLLGFPAARWMRGVSSISESSSSVAKRGEPNAPMSAELGSAIWREVSGREIETLMISASKPNAGEAVEKSIADMWDRYLARSKALGYSDIAAIRLMFMRGASPYMETDEARRNFLKNWANGLRRRDGQPVSYSRNGAPG